MLLPCRHHERLIGQVQPAIDLLSALDNRYPDILRENEIVPRDYHGGLVFRSAVESIRGRFIASSTLGRQGLIESVLSGLQQVNHISGFQRKSAQERYDFEIALTRDPDYFAVIEVKGGEGNSINISERPYHAREFYVWSHLDGAIVNQPSAGAHSVLNRITNELVRRGKQVDALFFRDVLCGTRARPCPKYMSKQVRGGDLIAPDVFLLPQRLPSNDDPEPPVHSLDTLRLPRLILRHFGVVRKEEDRHLWQVHVRIVSAKEGAYQRIVEVVHQGEVVDTSTSRKWRTAK